MKRIALALALVMLCGFAQSDSADIDKMPVKKLREMAKRQQTELAALRDENKRLKALLAELYGKETGVTGGRGGSMQLVAPEVGFLCTSAIVGGPVPIGVGAALAARLRKENRVSTSPVRWSFEGKPVTGPRRTCSWRPRMPVS